LASGARVFRFGQTDNSPTGAGEDGVPILACAVGNAIAQLTGVRLREIAVRAGARARRAGGVVLSSPSPPLLAGRGKPCQSLC
jgi:hypothetical protein